MNPSNQCRLASISALFLIAIEVVSHICGGFFIPSLSGGSEVKDTREAIRTFGAHVLGIGRLGSLYGVPEVK
jgi:hypothetical protein